MDRMVPYCVYWMIPLRLSACMCDSVTMHRYSWRVWVING